MRGVSVSQPDDGVRDRSGSDRLSLRQLAHELNSLLDGSRRYVDLARRRAAGNDALARDLDHALDGLQAMAAVLERAIGSPLPELVILRSDETLGRTVERLAVLLAPLAAHHGVLLECSVDERIAGRPAGLLESVLINGLRNAIEAVASAPSGPRRVEASVSLQDAPLPPDPDDEDEAPPAPAGHGGHVLVSIADSGPGPAPGLAPGASGRPGGHGVGLELCRRIVDELGGRIRLVRAPYERGTVLMVSVPADALAPGSAAA